jgi:CarD family transcriptional regulator
MQSGDVAIYPGHGISVVMAVEDDVTYSSGEQPTRFLVLKILDGSMTIRVNANGAAYKTLRPLASEKEALQAIEIFTQPRTKFDVSTWNRRFREYTNKVRSGKLLDLALVYRELSIIQITKNFSFGERKVYEQVQSMLCQELSCALNIDEKDMIEKVQDYFKNLTPEGPKRPSGEQGEISDDE